MRGRRTLVGLVGLGVVLLGVVAAFFLLRGEDEDDLGLAAFSNRGTPIRMQLPENLGPYGDVTGETILMAERGGLRFLRLPRKDGSSCWATAGRRGGFWSITGYSCEGDFVRFPDPRRPVMVLGRITIDPAQRLTNYQQFVGFAADGVKRVGVIDAEDRLIQVTGVTGNTFFTPDPPQGVKRLAALDAAGQVIWRGPEVPQPTE
jgi:catechol 2,3-dioxygenase-like lactoylglutathione lyase family enzyme